MVSRSGQSLTYDAENRLTGVSGSVTAGYAYDGDGQRVKATLGSGDGAVITAYAGRLWEQTTRYQETYDDDLAQGWTAASGTWTVTGGRYQQSSLSSNTNGYRALAQNGPLYYRWLATYASGTSAGLYLMASAGTGTERGNSYRIGQDATHVRLYENANNLATLRASFPAANTAGQAHSYNVVYDPTTGRLRVARDGTWLGSWTDTTAPLQSGAYLALRTDSANVLFDNLAVPFVPNRAINQTTDITPPTPRAPSPPSHTRPDPQSPHAPLQTPATLPGSGQAPRRTPLRAAPGHTARS